MSKLLGIDYGDKRVGLAIADSASQAMAPFQILENNKSLFENLNKIIKEEEIDLIVVGLPINLKNQPTIQTEKVNNFIKKLKVHLKIPIKIEDERLTSALHHDSNKARVDALSAMSILDSYLKRN